MMTSDQALDWIQSASATEIEDAMVAGELDAIVGPMGPGEVTGARAELVKLVRERVHKLNLDEWHCEWLRKADGRPILLVDGGRVVFMRSDDLLLMSGKRPDGRPLTMGVLPDGSMVDVTGPDLTSAAVAAWN